MEGRSRAGWSSEECVCVKRVKEGEGERKEREREGEREREKREREGEWVAGLVQVGLQTARRGVEVR